MSDHAEALARLDPDKIYVENVRSVLGVSIRQAEVICETAVRQGFFGKGVEALCPDGVVGASADRIENLPKTVHCWIDVDGHLEESDLPTSSLRKLVFYRFQDVPSADPVRPTA